MATDNTDSAPNTQNTAVPRTEVEYARQIKLRYVSVQKRLYDGALDNPSNGNIRDVCRQLLANNLPANDERVMRQFFGVAQDENLNLLIDREITSFRRVVNFLKGSSQETDIKNLNLIAVLIDFRARPYPEFLRHGVQQALEREEGPKDAFERFVETQQKPAAKARRVSQAVWVNVGLVCAIFLLLLVVGYFALFAKPTYMQWQTDHYVRAGASAKTSPSSPVEKMDETQFELHRVPVYDTTTFFSNGAPILWYARNNGYEFFDHPGYHPISKKALRPVSSAIATGVHDRRIRVDY